MCRKLTLWNNMLNVKCCWVDPSSAIAIFVGKFNFIFVCCTHEWSHFLCLEIIQIPSRFFSYTIFISWEKCSQFTAVKLHMPTINRSTEDGWIEIDGKLMSELYWALGRLWELQAIESEESVYYCNFPSVVRLTNERRRVVENCKFVNRHFIFAEHRRKLWKWS